MTAEQTQTMQLAIGRILRMGARAEQPGDGAEYTRCRNIIMDIAEGNGFAFQDMSPNYQRDRLKGAQGDA